MIHSSNDDLGTQLTVYLQTPHWGGGHMVCSYNETHER